MAKPKKPVYKPVRRYAFSWLAEIVGRQPGIPANKKAYITKRVSGLIVEKAWDVIIECAGIPIMEAVMQKLASVGDNVDAIVKAIEKAKITATNEAVFKANDVVRGISKPSATATEPPEFYTSLFDRPTEINPVKTVKDKDSLGVKKKSLRLSRNVTKWEILYNTERKLVAVLTDVNGAKAIAHTGLKSYFRAYTEPVEEGAKEKKLSIEYNPDEN